MNELEMRREIAAMICAAALIAGCVVCLVTYSIHRDSKHDRQELRK